MAAELSALNHYPLYLGRQPALRSAIQISNRRVATIAPPAYDVFHASFTRLPYLLS